MPGLCQATGRPVPLIDDNGTGWLTGTMGSAATMPNGSCAIGLTTSTAGISGNPLTLTLALAFTPAFGGSRSIYMCADVCAVEAAAGTCQNS